MGVPRFAPADVPFLDGSGATEETLDVDGVRVVVSVLSMGNPHAVQVVADVDARRSRRRVRGSSITRASRIA